VLATPAIAAIASRLIVIVAVIPVIVIPLVIPVVIGFVVVVVLQIIEAAENALCIKSLDGFQINVKVVNQVLHNANDFAVKVQQITLVVRRYFRVIHSLVKSVLQVSHSIHGAHRVGLLKMSVLGRNNTTYVLQLRLGPAL